MAAGGQKPAIKVEAQAGGHGQTATGWLWVPVAGDNTHPGETPKDEVSSSKRWGQNIRGPRLARIFAVTVLIEKKSTKPNYLFIMAKDVLKEVPKYLVLHEREGLLLIQELLRRQGEKDCLAADWIDAELRSSFEKHSQGKPVQSAQYVAKLLLRRAVTGVKFVDDKGRESSFRRDMAEKEDETIPPGDLAEGYFGIKEILDYMPPWEAFCNSKCGFYQDFYKVRWADPYSQIDYSDTENGCKDELGASWEPDESLPPCLDGMRSKMKKAWFTAQAERESKAKRALEQADSVRLGELTRDAKRLRVPVVAVKKEEEIKTEPKIEPAQHRRDASALDKDLFLLEFGHDFVPVQPDRFGSIRRGWPLHAKDYPANFGVASPPGFCKDGCDCMDDQRGQSEWEVTKNWIPKQRAQAAQAALANFTKETTFVRARGEVSKMFFFETADGNLGETPAQRAAADLSVSIQGSLREACTIIPTRAISSKSDVVILPARAIVSIRGNMDYMPLEMVATLSDGRALPEWILLNPETGQLSLRPDHKLVEDVRLTLSLKFYEGSIKTFAFTITSEEGPKLSRVLTPILSQLKDASCNSLDPGVRELLEEQLAQAAGASLSRVLTVLSRCQSMLRSSTVANLVRRR